MAHTLRTNGEKCARERENFCRGQIFFLSRINQSNNWPFTNESNNFIEIFSFSFIHISFHIISFHIFFYIRFRQEIEQKKKKKKLKFYSRSKKCLLYDRKDLIE